MWRKSVFDIDFTEYGTALTTILPILFLYLNTVIVTAGVIEPFSPIASFPPRKNGYIVGFPPEEWLYSGISPWKNGYIVGSPPPPPPERMTT